MQRLPYNGALRAHKLRHNVISSSLFNERWQRYVHTAQSISALLFSDPSVCPLRDTLTSVPGELVASRALRCQVSQT